jgi:hypothetical protein
MDKVDGDDANSTYWKKLDFLMGSDNATLDSKYSRYFSIFKDGYPGELIKWVIAFHEIENLMALNETANNTRMFQTLLKVKP